MEYICEEIMEHFRSKMAPVVAKLQAGTQTSMDADQSSNSASIIYSSEVPVGSLDAFGEELLQCCQGLHLYDVRVMIFRFPNVSGWTPVCCFFPTDMVLSKDRCVLY